MIGLFLLSKNTNNYGEFWKNIKEKEFLYKQIGTERVIFVTRILQEKKKNFRSEDEIIINRTENFKILI